MKFPSSFIPGLLFGLILTGCAHHQPRGPELTDYSPEQIEQLNREALLLASKRLEEMVIQARTNESTLNYLAAIFS